VNDDYGAIADRAASELLAKYGTPSGYDEIHNLLSVAYLHGGRAELRRIIDESEADKRQRLAAIGGDAA
jgi:hypothetical protein